jgi:hypothetical protein
MTTWFRSVVRPQIAARIERLRLFITVEALAVLMMLVRLDSAMPLARQLVVIVCKGKALYLAVSDWLRAPQYTALNILVDDILRLLKLTQNVSFMRPVHAKWIAR